MREQHKKLIFTFILLFVNVIATFAGCYNETVKAGTAAFNSGKYSYARQCFVSAKQCPDAPSNANSICDEWIRKIDNKLKPVDNTEAYYKKDLEKGERLFDNEQYANAKSHFQAMLSKYPKYKTDINRYIRMCEMCIADQEEDQQDAYQNGIRTGELLEESGEYEQAKLHYQTMLMTNPDRLLELNARIAVCEEAMRSLNKTFIVNGVSFTMIAVEGGTFTMGATSEQGSDARKNEKPTHNVTVSDFYMGETEVTQALWKAVMGSNPSNRKGDNLPVEQVSWNDCQEFIRKLNSLTGKNFSLPTEAEWEYAARGGNRSNGYIYSGGDCLMILLSDVAWYGDNSSSKTHVVKQKQANELGLYDMSGNVEEWCKDWYGDYSSSSQMNPTGPSTGSYRVLRGGCWDYDTRHCRVSYRCDDLPGYGDDYCGMRLRLAK